jgi:hypothetical protein
MSADLGYGGKPIADLFPETTVRTTATQSHLYDRLLAYRFFLFIDYVW